MQVLADLQVISPTWTLFKVAKTTDKHPRKTPTEPHKNYLSRKHIYWPKLPHQTQPFSSKFAILKMHVK